MKRLDYDIIIFALPRWDGLYSSTAYSLAKELSQHTRVFYIDNPFTYKDFIFHGNSAQIIRRKRALLGRGNPFVRPDDGHPNLIVATPELVLPVNWLPSGKFYDVLSKVNDRIVYRVIKKLLQEFSVRKFVFINSFNPLFGRYFPGAFSPELFFYHCVDDISRSEYVSKHGTYLEIEMTRRADATIVTSKELQRMKSTVANDVFYLPNAADVKLFQQALNDDLPKPAEIERVPEGQKIVFYMGNICHRVDYELLKKIAANKNYHLMMVGPVSNDNYRIAGLDVLSNVTFTGRKDLEKLPAYVKYSDCCIIPFLCIPLTKSIYPLKINEYLSAGKPVVTTNFSEDITNFGVVALVSGSHDEFLSNIPMAINSDTGELKKRRVEFAAGNNWKARAEELIEFIEKKIA
jgi:teichuronic acid biosynthesis glycosyltransferase TuaH